MRFIIFQARDGFKTLKGTALKGCRFIGNPMQLKTLLLESAYKHNPKIPNYQNHKVVKKLLIRISAVSILSTSFKVQQE